MYSETGTSERQLYAKGARMTGKEMVRATATRELARAIGDAPAAAGAVKIVMENPGKDIDQVADLIHQDWLERNKERATSVQKQDYANLPEIEKEKDRVIVREAWKAVRRTQALHATVTKI